MPDRTALIYKYDGSFEGFLCCVFESYAAKEQPSEIHGPDYFQTTFFPVREIVTNAGNAARVLASIPKKMGKDALHFLRRCFLTCQEQKEWYMLGFLRLGFEHGPRVMNMISQDVVNVLFKAENQLTNEAHLYTGFVRFSVFGDVLAAEIDPKNYVLPILGHHFANRYPREKFIIYDNTHGMALIHEKGKIAIGPMEDFRMPPPDEEELYYRALWQTFYKAITVPGRENPKCRMNHMPKRYWKYMTEFAYQGKRPTKAASPAVSTEKQAGLPPSSG